MKLAVQFTHKKDMASSSSFDGFHFIQLIRAFLVLNDINGLISFLQWDFIFISASVEDILSSLSGLSAKLIEGRFLPLRRLRVMTSAVFTSSKSKTLTTPLLSAKASKIP